MDRRRFLSQALAVPVLAGLPLRSGRTAPALPGDPFTLGVASGYPTFRGLSLWTRLAPSPLAPDGGLPPVAYPVEWEIAADQTFRTAVASGRSWAEPEWAHSVHVDVESLEPDREYWYRFHCQGATSPAGRARTAPAAGASRASMRLAIASCQQYEQGFYAAYGRMAESAPDLVLHVGDYIYEQAAGGARVRQHVGGECYTLSDYRQRYAQYKTDPQLQAAHAACPWLLTIDDHEVDNDFAGEISDEDDDPRLFLARRAAAFRAYYEHMPLPRRAVPFGPDMRLHATRSFGGLLSVHMLDGRQYRSAAACPRPGRRGANRVRAEACPELFDPSRSMLGTRQERWLDAALQADKARWTFMAQGVLMAQADEDEEPGPRYYTDSWNGYPAARNRLMDALAAHQPANPVVIGGDIHAFMAADLRQRGDDPRTAVLAAELVTTSITSRPPAQDLLDTMRRNTPDLKVAEGRHRGYLQIDLTADRLEARMLGVDDITRQESGLHAVETLVVEAGRRGLLKA
ncbi:MAG: hypothetical protein RL026_1139 [Pseudomonadota bacterium]|jgi:alkaline phosphatase D